MKRRNSVTSRPPKRFNEQNIIKEPLPAEWSRRTSLVSHFWPQASEHEVHSFHLLEPESAFAWTIAGDLRETTFIADAIRSL